MPTWQKHSLSFSVDLDLFALQIGVEIARPCHTAATFPLYRHCLGIWNQGVSMFQIVCCALDDANEVVARHLLQPPYELWEDATAMAEFDSSRIYDDYGYDEKRNYWWARNSRGQMYRFEVEEVTATELGNSTPQGMTPHSN
jgi:hypothetical protein